jgi:hypothetical protein
MSAIGPKQTSASAPHMSAFRGKADMTFCAAHVCFRPKADIKVAAVPQRMLIVNYFAYTNASGRLISMSTNAIGCSEPFITNLPQIHLSSRILVASFGVAAALTVFGTALAALAIKREWVRVLSAVLIIVVIVALRVAL